MRQKSGRWFANLILVAYANYKCYITVDSWCAAAVLLT